MPSDLERLKREALRAVEVAFIISFIFLLSGYSWAASYTDKNGVTHYSARGDSSGNQSDQSDYYLNVRPMQGKVDSYCNYAASDITSDSYDNLEMMINYGNVLSAQIKKLSTSDSNVKLRMEKATLQCQKVLLTEKKRRWAEEYRYASKKAAELRLQSERIGRAIEDAEAFLRRYNSGR
jgi:hypothetical protein